MVKRVAVVLGDPRLRDGVKVGGEFNPEDFQAIELLKQALAEVPGHQFEYLDHHATLWADLVFFKQRCDAAGEVGLVMNLCDEGYGNNPFCELHVPAMLEMLGLPYTGAGPQAMVICYDKNMVRLLAQAAGVPVPQEVVLRAEDKVGVFAEERFPLLVKPNHGDGSQGITVQSVVRNQRELEDYVAKLRRDFPERMVLVQEFLSGAEYSVCLVGSEAAGFLDLPILQVDYGKLDPALPQILGYESKWEMDSAYVRDIIYKPVTDLPLATRDEMLVAAKLMFARTNCRGYARFDFRCDSAGRVKLLEVNPNPGWCWDGKMNVMAGFVGMRYSQLLEAILRG
ncbi:MAG: ATP-grasp domain-containing protein [Proteobacteria bacterium]|nr:ATP-grasp domain-containing protein [Pseudomonadota bacterium]